MAVSISMALIVILFILGLGLFVFFNRAFDPGALKYLRSNEVRKEKTVVQKSLGEALKGIAYDAK